MNTVGNYNPINPRKVLSTSLELIKYSMTEQFNLYVEIYINDDAKGFDIEWNEGHYIVEYTEQTRVVTQFKTAKDVLKLLSKYSIVFIELQDRLSYSLSNKKRTYSCVLYECNEANGDTCYETDIKNALTEIASKIKRNNATRNIQKEYLKRYYAPGGSASNKAKARFEALI
jgi:hypothetical protein